MYNAQSMTLKYFQGKNNISVTPCGSIPVGRLLTLNNVEQLFGPHFFWSILAC